ncbi:MAG: conjugal transfer protein TraX [Bifidobacteriaceae bacterium]|nr:conjugal transfer protein TraX [Bifidobacteriaceae bacterium]
MPSKAERLSNWWLKAIGLTLLAGSMVGTAAVQRDMPADLEQVGLARLTAAILLEAASWVAIPIYAWLLRTGFARTRSVGAYAGRLALLAIVSEVPYDLASSGQLWDMTSQNPVFAVLASLLVLALGSGAGPRGPGFSRAARAGLWAALALAGALWLLFFNVGLRLGIMPTGLLVLVFVLLFYFLGERPNTMMFTGAAVGVLGGITPAFGLVILHFRNGQEGLRRPSDKLAFYVLYPLCLLAAGLYRVLAP